MFISNEEQKKIYEFVNKMEFVIPDNLYKMVNNVKDTNATVLSFLDDFITPHLLFNDKPDFNNQPIVILIFVKKTIANHKIIIEIAEFLNCYNFEIRNYGDTLKIEFYKKYDNIDIIKIRKQFYENKLAELNELEKKELSLNKTETKEEKKDLILNEFDSTTNNDNNRFTLLDLINKDIKYNLIYSKLPDTFYGEKKSIVFQKNINEILEIFNKYKDNDDDIDIIIDNITTDILYLSYFLPF